MCDRGGLDGPTTAECNHDSGDHRPRRPAGCLPAQFLLTRAVVGIIGLLLPLVLTTVGSQLGVPLQNSLSAFYHTTMGDYFVGSLFAIGTGLLVPPSPSPGP